MFDYSVFKVDLFLAIIAVGGGIYIIILLFMILYYFIRFLIKK
ncbi:hypothetical protein [Gracilibacillus caseinilyticus]|nr:hypothetical protein [Gracilibacillus caseinilyticus]